MLKNSIISKVKNRAISLITFRKIREKLYARDKELEALKLQLKANDRELEALKSLHSWFRWYYSEYASTLRMIQYNKKTLDINNRLIDYANEFIPIEDVTQKLIVPPPSNGPLTREYIFFAARYLFLPDKNNNSIQLYSMSYLGYADFIHSQQVYDAFIDYSALTSSEEIVELTDDAAGLLTKFAQSDRFEGMEYVYSGESKYFRPFAYNTGDLDQDGKDDFMLGGKLLLSSNNYDPEKSYHLPQESIFLETHKETLLVSLENSCITINCYRNNKLQQICSTAIDTIVYKNIPHVLYPLPLNTDHPAMFSIRSERGLDIYILNDSMVPELKWWITGLVEKEVLIGAFGNFINKDFSDFWISQVATGTERKACVDQLVLISSQQLLSFPQGEVPLGDVLYFTVKGSDKYSDYDGISSSLSPIAGDIDADGKPDLSFVGHRHMNEAGALYILLNDNIKKGGVLNITDEKIIKILGKPMSQLAPPYVHWDATDLTGNGHCDIIVSADNDLYSGLHAGAIYILDSKKILQAWHEKCRP
ncbi:MULTISPECIES: hypothetical protein [unclassified Legionella]|uniref:hypothetical protein n=1 Tax=unclassified Legionella TaxID=2622702 RepID=UPI001054AA91|nr:MULTISPECIES: hypothetical protein [unclassified Legionella]MDI9818670.1 hypothetical protein [Legionella sp. PL877]